MFHRSLGWVSFFSRFSVTKVRVSIFNILRLSFFSIFFCLDFSTIIVIARILSNGYLFVILRLRYRDENCDSSRVFYSPFERNRSWRKKTSTSIVEYS